MQPTRQQRRAAARRASTPSTILDRAIAWLAPTWAASRLQARRYLATSAWWSTDSARRGNRGWAPSSGDANADLNMNLADLREQSRDLTRNNPLAAGAIGTKVGNVVHLGLAPSATPDRVRLGLDQERAEALEQELERAWENHASGPDFSSDRYMDATELAALAYRSSLESGDVLLVRRWAPRLGAPYATCWQVIEGDRLINPSFSALDGEQVRSGEPGEGNRIYGGVERDALGQAVAYYVLRSHPGELPPLAGAYQTDRIPARDSRDALQVIHLARVTRPGQSRGCPDLATVITALHKLGKFTDAELEAAVTGSFLALAVTSQGGEGLSTLNPSFESGEAEPDDTEMALEPNSIFYLRQNEDIKQIKAEHPNNLFDPFVSSLLRQISGALGLPFEVLTKQFQSSYSAARAALLDAWAYFLRERSWLAKHLFRPWYEATIDEAVARGYVEAPGYLTDPRVRAAYLRCSWHGSAMPQINPMDEVGASRARIDALVSDRTAETQALSGRKWEDVARRQAREQQTMRDLGLSSTEQIGERIESKSTTEHTTPSAPGRRDVPEKPDPMEPDADDGSVSE